MYVFPLFCSSRLILKVVVDTKLQDQVTPEMFAEGYKIALEVTKGGNLDSFSSFGTFYRGKLNHNPMCTNLI